MMKKAAMAGALGFGLLIALLLSMFLIIASDEDSGGSGSGLYIGVNLSAEVLAHQPMVEKYARQNGISDYVYVLLAIIQVESEGKLEDVMQSSESAGLPVNTLGTEDSIKQGCKYFSELVAKADKLGCDMDAIIQAYNYGSGCLDFVARNGKRYTFELAQEFSRQHSRFAASSRPVRVAIAAELFFRKYGKWPEKAEELVPEFLSALPVDPFSSRPFALTRGIFQIRSAPESRFDGIKVADRYSDPIYAARRLPEKAVD